MTDMLIMSPPHWRYMIDSARVEKAGPGKKKTCQRCHNATATSGGRGILTLHADDGLASVELDVGRGEDLLDAGGDKGVELARERVAEHRVDDNAVTAEEGVLADTLGAVDDLVRDDKVARSNLLAERADGRERDNGLDAEVLESGNVGAGGNLGRGDGVVGTVARDEGNLRAVGERRDGDGRRGLAPGLAERISTW